MMTMMKTISDRMAAHRKARLINRATAHLDAKTLKDIGLIRDEWTRMTYRRM